MRPRLRWRALLVPGAVVLGCGSTDSAAQAPARGECGAGQVFCSTCSGGGFCVADRCPAIGCPAPTVDGGVDAGMPDAGACASSQVQCIDCNGNPFCTPGACPTLDCPRPTRDGAVDSTSHPANCPTGQIRCSDCAGAAFCAADCPPVTCPERDAAADAGAVVTCASEISEGHTSNPELRRTFQGTNGSFADSCDEAGNLIDYYCEWTISCGGPGPNPGCTTKATGKVVSQSYDCSGHCVNGACYARCPNFGDLMTYVTVDGASGDATLQNQTDLRTYVCKLIFDAPGDNYDCKTGPQPGLVVKMVTQGLRSQYCTGGDFGNFGVNDESASLSQTDRCAYGCVLPRG